MLHIGISHYFLKFTISENNAFLQNKIHEQWEILHWVGGSEEDKG